MRSFYSGTNSVVIVASLGHRISVRSEPIDDPPDLGQLYVLLPSGQFGYSSPDLLEVFHGVVSAPKIKRMPRC